MTGAQGDNAQGPHTDATVTSSPTVPSRYRQGSTESPWDALRAAVKEMDTAGIPVWEQNKTLCEGLRELARRAVDFHRIYGGAE